MKINETILLESFGDLKRFIDQYFISIFGKTDPSVRDWISRRNDDPALYQTANSLTALQDDLRRYIPETPEERPYTSKELLELIRFVIKDQRVQKWETMENTGNWIRLFKMSTSSNHFLPYSTLQQIFEQTIAHLIENPPKQKPKITEITKTQHYHIFELENFEAAVKVKNTFGVRWCIGSDRGWFDRYGESLGRKTYVVSLPNKTVFAIHSGQTMLMTTHDNEADVNEHGRGRGDEMRGIVDQMRDAGFNDELIPDIIISMLKKIDAPYTRAFVQELERVLSDNPDDTLKSLDVVVEMVNDSTFGKVLRVNLWNTAAMKVTTELFGMYEDHIVDPRTGEMLFAPGGRTNKISVIVKEMVYDVLMDDDIPDKIIAGVVDMMRGKVRELTNTRNIPQEYYLMFNKLNQVLGG